MAGRGLRLVVARAQGEEKGVKVPAINRIGGQYVLNAEVTIARQLRARLWLGIVLVKVAAWVMGVGLRVTMSRKDEEDMW